MELEEASDEEPDIWLYLMAVHVQLKNQKLRDTKLPFLPWLINNLEGYKLNKQDKWNIAESEQRLHTPGRSHQR